MVLEQTFPPVTPDGFVREIYAAGLPISYWGNVAGGLGMPWVGENPP